MTAKQLIDTYINYYKSKDHVQIPNALLVPENDPTTLFTSSGMQPLIPYLLGEIHPSGTKLVNVQNCFRANDFDDVGDNRHTTFFRMIGNWSLGDYTKEQQIPWFFEFLISKEKGLGLDPQRIFVSVFSGDETNKVPKDTQAAEIWKELFAQKGIDAKEVELGTEEHAADVGMQEGRIFYYGNKNWWSRSGDPSSMPIGEPGGPDSEVFYDFGLEHDLSYGRYCHPNCDCGRFMELGNSVFMQYLKLPTGTFGTLPKQNVDYGGGLERILAAENNTPDIYMTTLFFPIVQTVEKQTGKEYHTYARDIRMVIGHLSGALFMALSHIIPSNTEQGYIMRRSIRRALDSWYELEGKDLTPILTSIVQQYQETDPDLVSEFERIKLTILEEEQKYAHTRHEAQKYIEKRYNIAGGDEVMGETKEISADDAFILYSTHGLSPTQIKSLGFTFDEQAFAEKMKSHKDLSRTASAGKFKGGLADNSDLTVKGHTATHLLQQALRDVLGDSVRQTGSNITPERLRFDFFHPEKLTEEQIAQVQSIVREKIAEALPVHFEMLPLEEAKKTGAIGLFGDKYQDTVKVYFIGDYSKELCGGPHVENTRDITSFTITKQEKIGQQQMRLYAVVS